ncbi:hypothetical protein [Leptospira sp. GIMC2001]|uniref:hypothetical protein n=1 Tax=Leptospira sp. GIMC2001 TaxID=1513297 RepID=UPI002349DC63|nr:hypothetical protein [Leptospira sp. GIMC2001]WCL48232.1 hypothetical protein O4O04_13055 [Leptospira sp. GIMC2001]
MILNSNLPNKGIRNYFYLFLLLCSLFFLISGCKTRQSKYEGSHKLDGSAVQSKVNTAKKLE